MAAKTSIASELFSNLQRYECRTYCQSMIELDTVRIEDVKSLPISNTHYIDLQYCFVKDTFNPCHVLDYFSQYSGLDCKELRKQALDLVRSNQDHWVHVASVVLPLRPQRFDEWLKDKDQPTSACDKFFLFILSRLCHCMPTTPLADNGVYR